MNRFIKWIYLLTGTYFAILFVVIIFLQGTSNIGAVIVIEPNASSVIFLIATLIIAVILIIRLYAIYRKKQQNSLVAELLIGIFFFAAAWAALQALALVVDLTPLYLDWLFAKSVYIIMSVLSIFIAYFYFEVYQEGMKAERNFRKFLIIIAFALLYTSYTTVDVFNNFPFTMSLFFGAPTYAVIILIILSLIVQSFKTAKKVTSKIVATSFSALGWGGFALICGGSILIIVNLLGGKAALPVLEFIMLDASIYLALSLAMILLYIGFTHPMKKGGS